MKKKDPELAALAERSADVLKARGHIRGAWGDRHWGPVCIMGAVEVAQGKRWLGRDAADSDTRRIARALHRKLMHPWRPCLNPDPVGSMITVNDHSWRSGWAMLSALKAIAAENQAKIEPQIAMPTAATKEIKAPRLSKDEVNRIADALHERLKVNQLSDLSGLDLRETVEEALVSGRGNE